MQLLPSSDQISIGLDLRQCDGTVVDITGDRYVTLLIDRGQIDPSEDDHPAIPGIQIDLDDAGRFNDINLRAPADRLEGPTTLYAEYYRAALGKVTAAGYTTFQLSHDTLSPTVTASLPAADCGAGCLATGDAFVFRFSEPMDATSVHNHVKLERFSGADCTGGAIAVTPASIDYDSDSRTLLVIPPAPANPTMEKVTLSALLKDASAAANTLTPFARCAGVAAAAAPVLPAAPIVRSLSVGAFSPDGDAVDDSVSFLIGVDAASRIVQLRLWRADTIVAAQSVFVGAAGDYMLSWDGHDSTGRVVPNGIYRYEVLAKNSAGVASPMVTGVVEVASAIHWVSVAPRFN
jgi:hypothetical protein